MPLGLELSKRDKKVSVCNKRKKDKIKTILSRIAVLQFSRVAILHGTRSLLAIKLAYFGALVVKALRMSFAQANFIQPLDLLFVSTYDFLELLPTFYDVRKVEEEIVFVIFTFTFVPLE